MLWFGFQQLRAVVEQYAVSKKTTGEHARRARRLTRQQLAFFGGVLVSAFQDEVGEFGDGSIVDAFIRLMDWAAEHQEFITFIIELIMSLAVANTRDEQTAAVTKFNADRNRHFRPEDNAVVVA